MSAFLLIFQPGKKNANHIEKKSRDHAGENK